jgi:hypothetical protein
MVELDSYSGVDRSDSVVVYDEAETLKSNRRRAKASVRLQPVQESIR